MGVGGALWARLSQTRAPAATVWALRAVAPTALLLIATQAMDMAGTGTGALRSAAAWDAALRSPVGPAAACGVLAGLLAQRRHRVPVFAAWGLAALSFAAAGHAARAEPVALMASLVLVHALAVTFWAGALPVLIVALRRADAPAQMQRFSALAVPMVALLVLSGAVLAWRQIGSVGFLTSTAYGWAFVTKMALLLGVLAIAARHRLRMTPALAANESTARTRFGRSLRVELALMIALLAVTAAFRLTPPPRAITEAPASRSELHLHAREAMADIAPIPGQPGQNRLEIVPLDGDFQPFTPLEVTLYLSLPEAGTERIAAPAEKGADGVWTAGPVHLPQGGTWDVGRGTWDVVADSLITDFSKELIGGEITLSP